MSWWKHKQHKEHSNDGNQEIEGGKIDANHYAHVMIMQTLTIMSRTLEAGKSITDALSAYSINVENLETICYANEWLDDEITLKYSQAIEDFFIKNPLIDRNKMSIDQNYKLSRKKFQFLMKEILSNQMKYMEVEV